MSDMRSSVGVWVKRLSSPSKSDRQEAIRALADFGDVEALFALASVFASDPDEQIRLMAQKTGKAIYYNIHRQEQTPRTASDEERQAATDILAKAHAKKLKRR